MSYRSVEVRVRKEFVPAEAQAIAARLRAIVARARLAADRLRRSLRVLDADWEGRAKTRFVDAAQHDPGNLEADAAQAEDAAHRVETLTVTVCLKSRECGWMTLLGPDRWPIESISAYHNPTTTFRTRRRHSLLGHLKPKLDFPHLLSQPGR